MRRRSALGAAALLVLLLAIPASGRGLQRYVSTCVRSNLLPLDCRTDRPEVDFKAEVTPRRLPRRGFAPIGLTVSGTIGTESGGHPPALREAAVSVDEGIRIDTNGLARCTRRQLESLDGAGVGSACRKAIVGRGVARVGLASSAKSLRVPLTVVNGGTSGGVTRMFVHGAAGAVGGPLLVVAQL